VLDAQAKSIEAVKLKAIGKRNRVATMRVEKRRSQRELQALIEEKQDELERCVAAWCFSPLIV
jgi:intraflagellar transport protein 20